MKVSCPEKPGAGVYRIWENRPVALETTLTVAPWGVVAGTEVIDIATGSQLVAASLLRTSRSIEPSAMISKKSSRATGDPTVVRSQAALSRNSWMRAWTRGWKRMSTLESPPGQVWQ